MLPIYTTANLYAEKTAVMNYFTYRSEQKNYSHSYKIAIYNLINTLYESCVFETDDIIFNHPLVQQALAFATAAHKGQFRKFINTKYIIHPVEMASRLSALPSIEPEQLAAALLHDVVEDCGVNISKIKELFGDKTAYYVHYLTDPAKPEDGNRSIRMNINYEHFLLSDFKTKNIKITDLISNTRSILICDPSFASVYVPSLLKTFDYLTTIQSQLDPTLFKTLEETISLSKTIINLQNNFNILKLDKKSSNKPNNY